MTLWPKVNSVAGQDCYRPLGKCVQVQHMEDVILLCVCVNPNVKGSRLKPLAYSTSSVTSLWCFWVFATMLLWIVLFRDTIMYHLLVI